MYAVVRNNNGQLKVVNEFKSIPKDLILKPNEYVFKTDKINELKQSFVGHNKTYVIEDSSTWDISRLDSELVKIFVELLRQERYVDIFKIHNTMELSKETYCCNRHKIIAKRNIDIWQRQVLAGIDSQ